MQSVQGHNTETLRSSATAPLVLPDDQRTLSSEELLAHFQSISGRVFRNREDVHAYVSGLQGRPNAAKHWWGTVKQATWLALLVFAFLQYYAVDVLEEVNGLQAVEFNLPANDRPEDVKTYRS